MRIARAAHAVLETCGRGEHPVGGVAWNLGRCLDFVETGFTSNPLKSSLGRRSKLRVVVKAFQHNLACRGTGKKEPCPMYNQLKSR